MDHRRGSGAPGCSRAAHRRRCPDQIPPRPAGTAVPGREAGALALRADARRLARRDARLAAHHLRPGPVPRLDVRLPALAARGRRAVQHLDLRAGRGDRGKASARRRASAARTLTDGASSSAGRARARGSCRCAPHRRAATLWLLVLQLPHLVLSALHHRDHPNPTGQRNGRRVSVPEPGGPSRQGSGPPPPCARRVTTDSARSGSPWGILHTPNKYSAPALSHPC